MSKRKTQTASAELPEEAQAAPPGEAGQTAERSNVQRASVLSDPKAGMRFYFDYQQHRGEIAFADKPSPEVRTLLKDNGFNWDRDAHVWTVPIRFQQREQDRLAAKRTYHKAVGMVCKEKGIELASQPLPD